MVSQEASSVYAKTAGPIAMALAQRRHHRNDKGKTVLPLQILRTSCTPPGPLPLHSSSSRGGLPRCCFCCPPMDSRNGTWAQLLVRRLTCALAGEGETSPLLDPLLPHPGQYPGCRADPAVPTGFL